MSDEQRRERACGASVESQVRAYWCFLENGHDGPHRDRFGGEWKRRNSPAHGDQITTERGRCIFCESVTPDVGRAHINWPTPGHLTCVPRSWVVLASEQTSERPMVPRGPSTTDPLDNPVDEQAAADRAAAADEANGREPGEEG